MILIIHAHPYPSRSRATHALLQSALTLPEVKVHSLYERYPDFDIDIQAEQTALTRAHLTVWLHPLYWYSVPGMMKHYFDKVLSLGWAYGGSKDAVGNDSGRGRALHGKHCLWVPSTGGDGEAYSTAGIHANAFAEFVTPIETTARFCGMFWQPPFVVHGAHVISNEELNVKANEFKGRLQDWIDVHGTSFTAREAAA
jgi:glutathione-regulated potassium-efflux system ancillary protein KefF